MDLRSGWSLLLAYLRSGKALLAVGYGLAIFLPFLGLLAGAVIAVRRRTWHGVAIVVVSVASTFAILSIVADRDDSGSISPAMEREFRSIQHCLEKQLPHSGARRALRVCG